MQGNARLSPCRKYRYQLWRRWRKGPSLVWLLLNPSTADEKENDATIKRCIGFAQMWGYGRIDVINLFAFRSTNPNDLDLAHDPVGPENDKVIRRYGNEQMIAGWGDKGSARAYRNERALAVIQLLKSLNCKIFCLGVTKKGQPRHPVRLPYVMKPTRFDSTEFERRFANKAAIKS